MILRSQEIEQAIPINVNTSNVTAFCGASNNILMMDQFPQPPQCLPSKPQILNVPQLKTTKITEQDILTMPIVFYDSSSNIQIQKQIIKSKL